MDFISRMFTGLFNRKSQQYKQRATSRVRANTIGKVQGKLLSAQNKLDQKVNRAQDNALKGKFKGDGKKGKKGKGGPAAVGGGGGGGPAGGGGGGPAARGGGGPPMPIAARQAQAAGPRPSVAQRASGAAPNPGGAPQRNGKFMGKGKQDKNQAPMGQMAGCHNCGNAIQPDWDVCPYCGMAQGQMAAPHGGGGYGPPQPVAAPPDEGDRTMAVDLSALQKKVGNRPVVGWIVAQNGNHRGQDFRLYDGKNVLGTAADCDIVITDPYLSAKHCTIRHEDGNFVLIDLDSTNGTFVNQKRVSKMELIDNDTVRFGRTEFKFKALF